jgi:hypothetical protein
VTSAQAAYERLAPRLQRHVSRHLTADPHWLDQAISRSRDALKLGVLLLLRLGKQLAERARRTPRFQECAHDLAVGAVGSWLAQPLLPPGSPLRLCARLGLLDLPPR